MPATHLHCRQIFTFMSSMIEHLALVSYTKGPDQFGHLQIRFPNEGLLQGIVLFDNYRKFPVK